MHCITFCMNSCVFNLQNLWKNIKAQSLLRMLENRNVNLWPYSTLMNVTGTKKCATNKTVPPPISSMNHLFSFTGPHDVAFPSLHLWSVEVWDTSINIHAIYWYFWVSEISFCCLFYTQCFAVILILIFQRNSMDVCAYPGRYEWVP